MASPMSSRVAIPVALPQWECRLDRLPHLGTLDHEMCLHVQRSLRLGVVLVTEEKKWQQKHEKGLVRGDFNRERHLRLKSLLEGESVVVTANLRVSTLLCGHRRT